MAATHLYRPFHVTQKSGYIPLLWMARMYGGEWGNDTFVLLCRNASNYCFDIMLISTNLSTIKGHAELKHHPPPPLLASFPSSHPFGCESLGTRLPPSPLTTCTTHYCHPEASPHISRLLHYTKQVCSIGMTATLPSSAAATLPAVSHEGRTNGKDLQVALG